MSIGTRLYSLRVDRKLTVTEISERFGVSKNTVYRWERNYFAPKRTVLVGIAEFYGVSVDWILKGIASDKNFLEKRLSGTGHIPPATDIPFLTGGAEEFSEIAQARQETGEDFLEGMGSACGENCDSGLYQRHLLTLFSMLSGGRQERLVNYLNALCSEELIEKSLMPKSV